MGFHKNSCKDAFVDLAFALNRSLDLESALNRFFEELEISVSLKEQGIPRSELREIAFHVYRDAVNMATNPTAMSEKKVRRILEEIYC